MMIHRLCRSKMAKLAARLELAEERLGKLLTGSTSQDYLHFLRASSIRVNGTAEEIIIRCDCFTGLLLMVVTNF